eukprot:jgi/Mesen1/8071/ME000433S07366
MNNLTVLTQEAQQEVSSDDADGMPSASSSEGPDFGRNKDMHSNPPHDDGEAIVYSVVKANAVKAYHELPILLALSATNEYCPMRVRVQPFPLNNKRASDRTHIEAETRPEKAQDEEVESEHGGPSMDGNSAENGATKGRFSEGCAVWVKVHAKWRAGIVCSPRDCEAGVLRGKPTYTWPEPCLVFLTYTAQAMWAGPSRLLPISDSPLPLALGTHAWGRASAANPAAPRHMRLLSEGEKILDISDQLPVHVRPPAPRPAFPCMSLLHPPSPKPEDPRIVSTSSPHKCACSWRARLFSPSHPPSAVNVNPYPTPSRLSSASPSC